VSAVDDAPGEQRAGVRIAGETEADIYGLLDVGWIPTELPL
jgi:hypothetical protein